MQTNRALARAQLRVVPETPPQRVFAGEARKIRVLWQNPGGARAASTLRARLLQASSATVMPISEIPWRRLEVLPGQTVAESVTLDFPPVKAETRFLVQWGEGADRILGVTEVLAYPTNLVKALTPLAGDGPLGVFDPLDQLRPLLKVAGVDFADLESANLKSFGGNLAIIGPFSAKTQMRDRLASDIKGLARKGAAVVWIQPPPGPREELVPSFYMVPEGKGTVLVVQSSLLAGLAEDPGAQLNLIALARLAAWPQPFSLPNLPQDP